MARSLGKPIVPIVVRRRLASAIRHIQAADLTVSDELGFERLRRCLRQPSWIASQRLNGIEALAVSGLESLRSATLPCSRPSSGDRTALAQLRSTRGAIRRLMAVLGPSGVASHRLCARVCFAAAVGGAAVGGALSCVLPIVRFGSSRSPCSKVSCCRCPRRLSQSSGRWAGPIRSGRVAESSVICSR